MSEQTMYSPLKGIKVLDFTRLAPGPYGTALLVGMGAEVIKIEDLGKGDYIRHRIPGLYEALNRSKKDLAVDYRQPEGREIILKLAEKADVIIEAFRPGAMDHFGLGFEDIRKVNKGIIYCSLSGYGADGPLAYRAGHDPQYVAVSGLMACAAFKYGGEVENIPVAVADLGGGLNAALTICAALYGREKTGEGRHLDVALMDIPASWACASVGVEPKNIKPTVLPAAAFHFYRTKDNQILTMGNYEPQFWTNFCQLIGREDLVQRGDDETAVPEVQTIIAEKTMEEWTELLETTRVCWAPVTKPEDMLENEQLIARGFVNQSANGRTLTPILPFARPSVPDSPAPAQGADTREILASIGYGEEVIEQLINSNILK